MDKSINLRSFDWFSSPAEPLCKYFRFDGEHLSSILLDSVSLAIYSLLCRSQDFQDTEFSFDTGAFSVRVRSVEDVTLFCNILIHFWKPSLRYLPFVYLFQAEVDGVGPCWRWF